MTDAASTAASQGNAHAFSTTPMQIVDQPSFLMLLFSALPSDSFRAQFPLRLPFHESMPVEQMDDEIRPYFIHYRNQVGVNKALMDLFILVDQLLREDENAREPLRALQLVSDYVQQRQIVAPIPAELVDFYDSHNAVDPALAGHNPLAELSQLLASAAGTVPRLPSSVGHERTPHPRSGIPVSVGAHPSQCQPGFQVPPFAISPSQRGQFDLGLAFGDMPTPQIYEEQNPALRPSSRMNATDHRSALIMEVIREKLRSWLRRPETTALKNWVLRMRHKYQGEEPEWQHVYAPRPSYTASQLHGDQDWAPSQEFEGAAVTRSASNASLDVMPRPFLHGNIQVTHDVITYRDSLPAARRRSVSASMSRPLPPLPTRRESNSPSHDSPGSKDAQNGICASRSSRSRHRRNLSALPSQTSFNFDGPSPFISAASPIATEAPRRRRTSLRERAFSRISGKADNSPPHTKHALPPQVHLEMRQDPEIPRISIQPPSRPQTLSTTSVVSPYTASAASSVLGTHPGTSDDLRGRSQVSRATGSRHTTVQAIPHGSEPSTIDQSKGDRHSSAPSGGLRLDLEDSTKDWPRGRDSQGSLRTIRTSPRAPAPRLEEQNCRSTPASIRHGLPTPKSVENRAQLPLKTPVASLHHALDDRDGNCMAGPEPGVPPLTSRFSLDSHFTISSEYPDDRSISSCSDFHSVSEATSHEGEFLARLASRRKKPMRSGSARQSERASGVREGKAMVKHVANMQLAPMVPAGRGMGTKTAVTPGEHSRSRRNAHRHVLSH